MYKQGCDDSWSIDCSLTECAYPSADGDTLWYHACDSNQLTIEKKNMEYTLPVYIGKYDSICSIVIHDMMCVDTACDMAFVTFSNGI